VQLWLEKNAKIKVGEEDDDYAVADERPKLEGFKENLYFCIPAIMFTVTNNVHFMIMERLDPGTVSVMWQLKIPLTALLMHLLAMKTQQMRQWIGIVLLTTGVLISQSGTITDHGKPGSVTKAELKHETDAIVGLVLCFISLSINVSANVVTECLFKRTSGSQYAQYIRLYSFGVLLNMLCLLCRDFGSIMNNGIFQGYNAWTLVCILCLALAGFVVGMTIKQLDNIVVVFADVSATVVSSVVSWYYFDLHLTVSFIGGVMVCGYALYLYYSTPEDASLGRMKYQAVKTALEIEDDDDLGLLIDDSDLEVDSDEDLGDFEM